MTGSRSGSSQVARMVPWIVLARVIPPMSRGPAASGTWVMVLASAMVTLTESEAAWVPSLTVSVKLAVAVEVRLGAANPVEGEVGLSRVRPEIKSWLHE